MSFFGQEQNAIQQDAFTNNPPGINDTLAANADKFLALQANQTRKALLIQNTGSVSMQLVIIGNQVTTYITINAGKSIYFPSNIIGWNTRQDPNDPTHAITETVLKCTWIGEVRLSNPNASTTTYEIQEFI